MYSTGRSQLPPPGLWIQAVRRPLPHGQGRPRADCELLQVSSETAVQQWPFRPVGAWSCPASSQEPAWHWGNSQVKHAQSISRQLVCPHTYSTYKQQMPFVAFDKQQEMLAIMHAISCHSPLIFQPFGFFQGQPLLFLSCSLFSLQLPPGDNHKYTEPSSQDHLEQHTAG